ncbi:MAG: TonB-dependent receptor [Bacteroidetes bacterium]|nr:TonB-dependent receptor [Bacteroidota bacterium]
MGGIRKFLGALCIVLAAFGSVLGQDASEPYVEIDSNYVQLQERILDLDEVQVRAGLEDPAKSTLRPSEMMAVRRLDQIPATSRIEALAALPGVDMVSNGSGTLRPIIRGLSGLRVATLFNGARIESQAWGEYHGIYIPEEGVEAVQVIRGPATLAYGSDAYGGVLNFIPKAPLSDTGRQNRLSLSTFSATSGWQLTGATEKRSERTFHSFRGGYKHHGDYILPSGNRVQQSAYEQFFGQGSFGYVRPWGVIEGAYSSAYNSGGLIGHDGWQQSGDHLITTSLHTNVNGWDVKPRLSYQLNHRKEFESIFESVEPEDPSEFEELALDISLRTLRWEFIAFRQLSNGWSSSIGVQGFQSRSQFDDDEDVVLIHTPLIPDADIMQQSAFSVFNRDFDNGGVQFATRVDRRETISMLSRIDWLKGFAGGTRWNIKENLVLHMNVAHSERVPGLSELFSEGVHHCAFRYERGDANLAKEQSFNVESNVVWNPGWGQLELSMYQNAIQNYVYLRPTQDWKDGWRVYDWRAVDARFNGAEASIQFAPKTVKHFNADAAFSVVHAADKTGETLPLIPPTTLRTSVGWIFENAGQFENVFARAILNENRDATLVHFAAGATWNGSISVNFSIQNLFNQTFTPTLSMLRELGIPEPGRNARVQVGWKF